jgi:hypothetical protein
MLEDAARALNTASLLVMLCAAAVLTVAGSRSIVKGRRVHHQLLLTTDVRKPKPNIWTPKKWR